MRRVLVVDDDPDIRLLVRSVFETRGWDVDEAPDGEQALARPLHDYDVILLDQMMPGLRGDEVAVELRKRDFTRPIVFYSAYITPELVAELREQVDVDLHIVAKTDFAKLVEIVHRLSE